ncbi:Wd Repeat And Fyve Domain-Containing Protein 3, partial [Manis pentadactyla]
MLWTSRQDTTTPPLAIGLPVPLGTARDHGQHHRWPPCGLRTTTTWAVFIWSSLAPYDAVGGTDDGLGLLRKADDDPICKPPPSGEAPTTAPWPWTSPGAAKKAILKADAQNKPMDMIPSRWPPSSISPLTTHEAVGSFHLRPKGRVMTVK